MTPQTGLELEFGDGVYLFDLKLPQLLELQEKCGVGVLAVYARVLKGRYLFEGTTIGVTGEGEAHIEDIRETIRLGLIGGGGGIVDGAEAKVTALTAKTLVERYVDHAPLRDAWAIAAAVLGARVEGYTPPKKEEPASVPATPRKRSSRGKSSRTAKSSVPTGAN